MATPQDATAQVAATYNAAADSFDQAGRAFWDRFSGRTIEPLTPSEQERVRELTVSRVRDEGIKELEANVVYALATKN